MAHEEVDIRFVGAIRKRQLGWHQASCRPLLIGCSVGHRDITAGTLGCFVRVRSEPEGSLRVLSNNHVLANENRGVSGDEIVQPGRFDQGMVPRDVVARLESFVPLEPAATNFVDAALARLAPGFAADATQLREAAGPLRGLGPAALRRGMEVAKLGRTTGLTLGRVTAFEMDNVAVDFDAPLGAVRFDNQIEIEGSGPAGFSEGGDSGALVWSLAEREAVGLLFSGSEQGGANDQGLTYANPIHAVLAALEADLAL